MDSKGRDEDYTYIIFNMASIDLLYNLINEDIPIFFGRVEGLEGDLSFYEQS